MSSSLRTCLPIAALVTQGMFSGRAEAEPRCPSSEHPWVMVEFDEDHWGEPLRERIFQDLRAGFASRSVETCRTSDRAQGLPSAMIRIVSMGATSATVSVEVRDALTQKKVIRDIDLSAVPDDGRALAIALGADELVWASWAEVALTSKTPRRAAPKELVVAIRQRLPSHRRADKIGILIAADRYSSGLLQLGPDLVYAVSSSEPFRLRMAGGFRQGVPVEAPDGRIRGSTFALFLGPELSLLRSSLVDLGVSAGGRAGWVHFQGDANPSAAADSFSGFFTTLEAGLLGALHLGGTFWIELATGAGWVVNAVEVTDSSRVETGLTRLKLSASLSLFLEI